MKQTTRIVTKEEAALTMARAIEQASNGKTVRSFRFRGLGDVVAAATSAVGIKPCGGCKQRQEALNKMIPFGNANEEGKNDGPPSV